MKKLFMVLVWMLSALEIQALDLSLTVQGNNVILMNMVDMERTHTYAPYIVYYKDDKPGTRGSYYVAPSSGRRISGMDEQIVVFKGRKNDSIPLQPGFYKAAVQDMSNNKWETSKKHVQLKARFLSQIKKYRNAINNHNKSIAAQLQRAREAKARMAKRRAARRAKRG